MSTRIEQTPWTKYGLTRNAWEKLDVDERRKVRYDHWYENNKDERNARRRKKYDEDDEHRQKVLDGCKRRRPKIRRSKARAKFQAKLDEAKERETQRKLEQSDEESEDRGGGGRKGLPRLMRIAGKDMWIHTSHRLALGCGRGQSTIRAWLAQDVLPGVTLCIKDCYYFSDNFILAVRAACRRIYAVDGNGSRDVLARLIREELMKRECSWVPPGEGERERVGPGNYPEIEAA